MGLCRLALRIFSWAKISKNWGSVGFSSEGLPGFANFSAEEYFRSAPEALYGIAYEVFTFSHGSGLTEKSAAAEDVCGIQCGFLSGIDKRYITSEII